YRALAVARGARRVHRRAVDDRGRARAQAARLEVRPSATSGNDGARCPRARPSASIVATTLAAPGARGPGQRDRYSAPASSTTPTIASTADGASSDGSGARRDHAPAASPPTASSAPPAYATVLSARPVRYARSMSRVVASAEPLHLPNRFSANASRPPTLTK